jgi:hypothetical protein
MASYPVTFCALYEFITQSLFADLRLVSIYLWQNKRNGENGPSLTKWRHPSIVNQILKSISFPYPT